MSTRALHGLFARVFNRPLMVTPAKLDAFLLELPALFQRPGGRMDDSEGEAPPRRTSGYSVRDGVATLPVHGVLVKRAGQIDGTTSAPLQSYERIAATLQGAMRDSRVRAVLLDIDTPGGESGGVLDLARDIRAASQVKPVWSIANDDAFSAGYALASAASQVWLTRSGGAGSVGVVALHTDQSAYDAREGLKFTHVFAGAHKVDGTSHAPLGADARARIQGEVDRLYGMFVETVAGNRQMAPQAVRATEAGLYFGEEAVFAGLADQVGTPAEAAAALAAKASPPTRARSALMSETQQPPPQDPPPEQQPEQPAQQPAAQQPGQPAQQPAEQPEKPAATEQRSADVIALAAATGARGDAVEIAELCQLAGMPEQTSEMLKSGLATEQVRRRLITLSAEKRAQQPIVPVDASAAQPRTGPAPITAQEAYGRFTVKGG